MSEPDDDVGQVDEAAILEAYCRAQLAELPQGSRGLRAAKELLAAIPAAYRLGWTDTTASAPELFRLLKDADLISRCPSGSDLPAALRLVASVCGLITQRSARRWTVWFSRACDPDHTLGASIRKAVTPAMLRRSTSVSPPRKTSNERGQTAADTGILDELAELKREYANVVQERDLLKHNLGDIRADIETLKLRIEDARADFRRVSNSNTTLHRIINQIQNVLSIEPYDPEAPDNFVNAVERVFLYVKAQVGHIATVLTRNLDGTTIRYCITYSMLQMLRHGSSDAEIEAFSQSRSPELLQQYVGILNDMRAKIHAANGIVLPPPNVTVDDLHVSLKPLE